MPCFGTCNTLRFNTEFIIDDKTIKNILPQKLHVLKIVKSYMIEHIYFPLTVCCIFWAFTNFSNIYRLFELKKHTCIVC